MTTFGLSRKSKLPGSMWMHCVRSFQSDLSFANLPGLSRDRSRPLLVSAPAWPELLSHRCQLCLLWLGASLVSSAPLGVDPGGLQLRAGDGILPKATAPFSRDKYQCERRLACHL